MHIQRNLIAGLVLGGFMLAGCEESPEARPAPNRTPGTITTPDRTTTPAPTYNDSTTSSSSPQTPVTGGAQAAQSMIVEVRQHINAGRFDEAELLIVELEGMKSTLPQATQADITQLRTDLRQKQSSGSSTTPPTTPPTVPPSMPPTTPPSTTSPN